MIDTEEDQAYWGEGEPGGDTLPADEYAAIIEGMVRDFAPRRFAIVQHWGERNDGRIAAWGLKTDDRTDIIDTDGQLRTDSVGLAIRLYTREPHLTASVVWVDPESDVTDSRGGLPEIE